MSSPTHTLGKTLSWATFLLVLVIAQITTAKAASAPTIAVEPYASTAQTGESFTVNISLTDVQNLYGVEVTLHWNASVLQIVGVDIRLGVESHSDGVLHEPIFIAENETIQKEGRYLLAGVSTSPADSFGGDGNILSITFDVTSVGSCKLNVETKLSDWPPPEREPRISWPIAHNTIDGFFGRQIKLSTFPMMITITENISIGGSIIPPQPDQEVTILYRREGETDWLALAAVTTNDIGNYMYVWQPQHAGKYEIKTTFTIEGEKETSSSAFLTVKALEQPPTWQYIAVIIAVIVIVGITTTVIYRKRSGRRTQRNSIAISETLARQFV